MERVLKRIALHGILTALVLGVIGAMFTQIAAMWMASSTPARVGPVEPSAPPASDPVDKAIRYRVPLTMAAWGVAFVVVSELLVFAIRGEKKPPAPPPAAQDDPAEKLLEELLSQAETTLAKEKEEQEKKKAAEDASHAASILTPDPPAPDSR
jgi:hypothetical protein